MNNRSTYSPPGAITGPATSPATIDLPWSAFPKLEYHDFEFGWEQAVRVLRKNRSVGMWIFCVSVGLLTVGVLLMPDVYKPVATIEIAPPTSGMRTLHEIESSGELENEYYLETQTEILKSNALAVSVIRQLKLDKKPEFMSRGWGFRTASKALAAAPARREEEKSFLGEQLELSTLTASEAAALGRFQKNLSVSPVRNTRLVEVSFASRDPELAREVTNSMIATYIASGYRQRYNATTQASEWLSSQLEDLHDKVVTANRAVSDYQRRHGLVDLNDRDVPLSQLMAEVNHQLSDVQATRIENEAYLRMIALGQTEYVPTVRNDPLYQSSILREGELRTQLAQARAVYGDENTNIKKLEDQLAELSRQMEEERKRIADRIRTAYAAAKEEESLMLQKREVLRRQMVEANSQLVGYHILKNEAIADADLYNTLQARLKEAGIYAGLGSNNIRVVDLAENLQGPTGPPRGAYLATGTLLSAFLALFACFFRESLNNTVRTPEDVRSWVGLKSLALLPVIKSVKRNGRSPNGFFGKMLPSRSRMTACAPGNSIALMKPLSAEAEAMRDLRTALLSSEAAGNLNTFLICSGMEGEGKTTVAVNFAIALAQVGRTCLVDADLRRPMVAHALGVRSQPGLSEVLKESVLLPTALAGILNIPGLWLLPSGAAVESPADVLASKAMLDVCSVLRTQFQFVVVDSPPLIRFSDARYLSRLADEVILVGRYGITTRRAIQWSAELLRDSHARLAGVVLNGIDYSSPDYHYFAYGYSRAAAKQTEAAQHASSLPV